MHPSKLKFIVVLMSIVSVSLFACKGRKEAQYTPWGTAFNSMDSTAQQQFSLADIQDNGELIVLTMSGPTTYYDYQGRGMGLQYLLAERFAQQLGVQLRVEVCKDTTEMVHRLQKGDGDLIAFPLPHAYRNILYCGVKTGKAQWAVQQGNTSLADSLNSWFKPALLTAATREEQFALSSRSITRHVYSSMLNRSGGVISQWDAHFKRYAMWAGWDWRLLAAQCYQESTFDPNARSWAGACGLMQIIPSTADHLGIPRNMLFDPEQNIAGAAKYIRELTAKFRDVPNPLDRACFVLASYNGGFFHIRDAMALARKYGKDAHRWTDVQEFILHLTTPAYYRDPVVKYGYMRGTETTTYVNRIMDRWAQYRGFAKGGGFSMGNAGFEGFGSGVDNMRPTRAKHKNRFQL